MTNTVDTSVTSIEVPVPTSVNYPATLPTANTQQDNDDSNRRSSQPSTLQASATNTPGFRRQKSSSSETEESRRRRFHMPLAYLMYESQSEELHGTVYGPEEEDFHPEEASKALRQSLSGGIQSDDKVIIQVLLTHTNYQRQKIRSAYEGMYSRNLAEDIEEEVGGYFLDSLLALIQPAHVYSARMLYYAISGRSRGRGIAVEIALTSTASQLKVIRDAYQAEYRVMLERDLGVKVEGLFGRMLHQLLMRKEEFDESVDVARAEREVDTLLHAGDGGSAGIEEIGRNLDAFNRIFGQQGLNQVRIFVERFDIRQQQSGEAGKGRDFESMVRKNVNIHSDTRQMILMFVRISRNMQLYFAERLHEAISGVRPDNATIIRILVSRSEIDLCEICDEYKRKYGRHIALDLHCTCSGDFLRLLNRLVKPPPPSLLSSSHAHGAETASGNNSPAVKIGEDPTANNNTSDEVFVQWQGRN